MNVQLIEIVRHLFIFKNELLNFSTVHPNLSVFKYGVVIPTVLEDCYLKEL